MFCVAFMICCAAVLCTASKPDYFVEEILPEVKIKGETGRLNCTVKNLPPHSSVLWVFAEYGRNDRIISEDGTIYWSGSAGKYEILITTVGEDVYQFQLIIRSLESNDTGMYRCLIMLPEIPDEEWPMKNGFLIVQTPPVIRIYESSPHYVLANQTDNVTLRCAVDSFPSPNITWIRDDRIILSKGSLSEQGQSGVYLYRILNVTVDDRGKYTCLADNGIAPSADHTINLKVRFIPICIPVQAAVGKAMNRQYSAQLDCKVTAFPEASVKWFRLSPFSKSRQQIYESDKYRYELREDSALKPDESVHSLVIRNVQRNDYGEYFCTAENEYGRDEAEFNLYECEGQGCQQQVHGKKKRLFQ